MIDVRTKLKFARAMRHPDAEAVKRLTEHFEGQNDLFTQCPRCHAKLRGTLTEIKAHICPEIVALIGDGRP